MAAAAANIAEHDMIQAELMTGHTGVRITGVSVQDMGDAQVEEVMCEGERPVE